MGALKNAWDTSAIIDDTNHLDERTFVHPLPPLPAITFQDQVWRGEEQHNQDQLSHIYAHDHHQPAEHHEHHADDERHHDDHAQELSHDHGNVDTRHHEDTQAKEYHHHAPEENYGMLNWNPSWEEPPQNQSAVDIPNLQIYGNAWDNPQSHNQVWVAPSELPPPPPSVDYHHHYIHTPAHSQNEEQVSDWQHEPVFPWEEEKQLRHMPTRIWQDEQELEKRLREEEEYRRIEAEKAAAEAESRASVSQRQDHGSYHEQHNHHHTGDMSGKQEVIQQAFEVENDIIEQTISEAASHPQEQPSTLDQTFVSVWDQMPDIQRYLARIGVHDAFKNSEYQPLISGETEGVEEILEQEEHAGEEEEVEEDEGSEEEYEELEDDSEGDEEENEEPTKITKPVHLDIGPPPTLAQSWWGEPFAIDSMPTTPLIGKSGARSPMLPMTPRLEDDDWDDRDLIPLPLKRTSKLFQGDAPVFPESKMPMESKYPVEASTPDPSLPLDDSSLKQKKKRRIKKLRKMFADENDMMKKTPFASAVTTPTSEGFILPPVEVEETVVETVNLPRTDSFGDYKIEWASDLLKGHEGVVTPARTPSKEVASTSYFDVTPATSPAPKKKSRYNIYASRSTWDPLHALKSLRASGEKLLIKTKFESNDPEESDDEYAPAAYYNNDDEEDLGVLGLTFPASRAKKEYAMSKLEDSPPNDSVSVSPATPTAKGMSMNLTDKIMQEAVERRINTDIALHEAATSLVKSTEAAYNDDGYAMSPTTEEFPHFNVSATELEMSQDNSSRRRRSTAGSEAQFDIKPALEQEKQETKDGNESKEVPNEEPVVTSDPVHSDIIQAATDKLKQIAGIDWEAETKEQTSHMEDTKNWVFAQRSEGVTPDTSAAETDTHEEEQPASDDTIGEQEVPSKVLGDVAAAKKPEHLPQIEGDVSDSEPEVAGTSNIPASENDTSTESTESASPSNVVRTDFRSNAPGQLSFSTDDTEEAVPQAEKRDSLKTPTQSSFAVSTLADQSEKWPSAQDDASESTSSVPDDVEPKLRATAETSARKVETSEPTIHTTESSAPLMNRDTSLSQSSIDGAESARSHFSNSNEEQLEVPGEATDIDDTSSDTQWLSATEGDRGSESGASADWFSVQSFDNSANQSEDEEYQLHGGSDIHRDFLRRFVEHSDLQRSDLQHEISSLDSPTPYAGTEEDSIYEDPLVSDESGSTTDDKAHI